MSTQPYSQIKDKTQENQENQEKSQHCSDKNSKVLYIVLLTAIVFTLEIFVRGPFTRFSELIQENLNFPLKCEIGDVFVWFKYQGKAVIFLLLFNVSNIYVSLSMIILDSLAIFINGTLKLIYTDPRPFWVDEKLVPCTCATNYGSPSTTSLDIYLVCIVVYRALINRSNKKWWKVLIWCFFLIPQALAWISRFIQNIHSLHQLVFGLLCGYIVQYIYFEIMDVDMESTEQLKFLINSPAILITLAISTVSWVFFNALHYYFVHVSEPEHMLEVIGRYCSTSIEFYMFDNESYQKTAMAFLFMGSIFAILLEYYFFFESDFEKFSKYNMGKDRWTETDEYKTTLRIIVMYILGKILLPLPKWGSKKHDSVYYLNLSKCICKNFFKGIFYFFIIKLAFRYLTLTNESSGVFKNSSTSAPLLDKKEDEEETKNLKQKN